MVLEMTIHRCSLELHTHRERETHSMEEGESEKQQQLNNHPEIAANSLENMIWLTRLIY